ncbi:ABC transporter substrate-binding protein [Tenacibaculum sp. UWU-22]|uniref:ABC transporter substrate-binding protein n=1 Tax=Tenacibaculum sp. UWU-22 TaxID=3234187 RepID=UPI0034DB612E
MKNIFYPLFLVCFLSVFSCKQVAKKQINKPSGSTIKYAKGFDIVQTAKEKKIIIKSPYPNANKPFEYTIENKNNNITKHSSSRVIYVPIKKMVVTSTTHIPMIELLNEEKTLIGFPHTQYVSSEKTRALIEAHKITDIGKEASLNTEILLSLNPELVVAFSMSKTNKALALITKQNIPVILNGDWLEETPLGRAEWIKFFGILYNKEKMADSIFNIIEKNYIEAKKIAKNAITTPTILSGAIMNKDIWNLPAGNSFIAHFFKDANTNYLWQNNKGRGSLSLSFESVLDKGKAADFWISPGYFSTKNQLINSNKIYQEFKAFKTDNIYTPNLKKGKTAGIIYFELAPTRPDLVLKDIIKITHPELLPNYKFTFFEKMKF